VTDTRDVARFFLNRVFAGRSPADFRGGFFKSIFRQAKVAKSGVCGALNALFILDSTI